MYLWLTGAARPTLRQCVLTLAFGLGGGLAVSLTALQTQAPVQGQVHRPDELHIKAAVLSKFAHFVSWPTGALPAEEEFRLCLLPPNRLAGAVESLTAGERVEGRPLVVREVESVRDVRVCHLLFVPEGASPAALRLASSLPILTVGEGVDFLDRGGIIRLRPVGSRLRFDINAGQAQRVGLILSAQLLSLAESVRGGRP